MFISWRRMAGQGENSLISSYKFQLLFLNYVYVFLAAFRNSPWAEALFPGGQRRSGDQATEAGELWPRSKWTKNKNYLQRWMKGPLDDHQPSLELSRQFFSPVSHWPSCAILLMAFVCPWDTSLPWLGHAWLCLSWAKAAGKGSASTSL